MSQNPSKLTQAGALLGRAVLRCQDEDASVRAAAQQCARLVLLIAGKYEGLTSDDAELEQAFSSMSLATASCNELLAKVSLSWVSVLTHLFIVFQENKSVICFILFSLFLN